MSAGKRKLTAVERKRLSRQRTEENITQLFNLSAAVLEGVLRTGHGDHAGDAILLQHVVLGGAELSSRRKSEVTLALAVRAMKHLAEEEATRGQTCPSLLCEPQWARSGMMLSTSLGTLLVRTSDLVVLESNLALDNFWMISTEREERGEEQWMQGRQDSWGGGRQAFGLVGQSMWSFVHWDNYDEVEDMQGMFRSRNRSVVGRKVDLRLIRMTRGAVVGELAKVVRRRVEVLSLSADGESALLAVVDVKEEDRRELQVGEEGMTLLNQGPQVFKLSFGDGRAHGLGTDTVGSGVADAGDSIPFFLGGLSLVNMSAIVGSLIKYTPDFYIMMGLSEDGCTLRHMAHAKLGTGDHHLGSRRPQSLPLINFRIGDHVASNEWACPDGTTEKHICTLAWFLPGDDLYSSEFPWRFRAAAQKPVRERRRAALNAASHLAAFWTWKKGVDGSRMMTHSGWVHLSQVGPIISTRRTGGVEEGRPSFSDRPRGSMMSEWEGMEEDILFMRYEFLRYDGVQTFFDNGEQLSGVWHDAAYILCDTFGFDPPDAPPIEIKRVPINHPTVDSHPRDVHGAAIPPRSRPYHAGTSSSEAAHRTQMEPSYFESPASPHTDMYSGEWSRPWDTWLTDGAVAGNAMRYQQYEPHGLNQYLF
jgi:hypothetical protein